MRHTHTQCVTLTHAVISMPGVGKTRALAELPQQLRRLMKDVKEDSPLKPYADNTFVRVRLVRKLVASSAPRRRCHDRWCRSFSRTAISATTA